MGINNPGGGGGSSSSPTVVTDQGLGTFATNQVAVAATATIIAAARATRSGVLIVNPSAIVIYVGPLGVTTGSGVPVNPGGWIVVGTTAAVYGISASGTNTVAYGEVY